MRSVHFQVYKDAKDEWRWRLVAANGKIIAVPGEGYKNKNDCLHDIDLVKAASAAEVRSPAPKFRWGHLEVDNSRTPRLGLAGTAGMRTWC